MEPVNEQSCSSERESLHQAGYYLQNSIQSDLLHNDCIDEEKFRVLFSISLEPIQSEKERNWNLALHAPKMLNVTLPLIVMWKI